MTDNALCYTQRRYAEAVARLGLRHKRTRPYTPRTNRKVERFIQTALREWAYVKPSRSSTAASRQPRPVVKRRYTPRETKSGRSAPECALD